MPATSAGMTALGFESFLQLVALSEFRHHTVSGRLIRNFFLRHCERSEAIHLSEIEG